MGSHDSTSAKSSYQGTGRVNRVEKPPATAGRREERGIFCCPAAGRPCSQVFHDPVTGTEGDIGLPSTPFLQVSVVSPFSHSDQNSLSSGRLWGGE